MSMPELLDPILKVVEIVSIVGGGGIVVFKFGRMAQKVESTLSGQSTQIQTLQSDIRKLNDVITAVAVQSQRIDMISSRQDILDRRYDDLRHGHGFVLPLPGATS